MPITSTSELLNILGNDILVALVALANQAGGGFLTSTYIDKYTRLECDTRGISAKYRSWLLGRLERKGLFVKRNIDDVSGEMPAFMTVKQGHSKHCYQLNQEYMPLIGRAAKFLLYERTKHQLSLDSVLGNQIDPRHALSNIQNRTDVFRLFRDHPDGFVSKEESRFPEYPSLQQSKVTAHLGVSDNSMCSWMGDWTEQRYVCQAGNGEGIEYMWTRQRLESADQLCEASSYFAGRPQLAERIAKAVGRMQKKADRIMTTADFEKDLGISKNEAMQLATALREFGYTRNVGRGSKMAISILSRGKHFLEGVLVPLDAYFETGEDQKLAEAVTFFNDFPLEFRDYFYPVWDAYRAEVSANSGS